MKHSRRKPAKLWHPDFIVPRVVDVAPAWLQAQGIRAVMVDLDDTLVASQADWLEPAYTAWLAALQREGLAVMLLSNGTPARVRAWSAALAIDGLALVGKPWPQAFWRGLHRLGYRASESAMIGDQLFTDVLGANAVGMLSILVTPLSSGRRHTRVLRRLERRILASLPADAHLRPR